MKNNSKVCTVGEFSDIYRHYNLFLPTYNDDWNYNAEKTFEKLLDSIIENYKSDANKLYCVGTVEISHRNEIVSGHQELVLIAILLKEIRDIIYLINKKEFWHINTSWLETREERDKERNGCQSLSEYFLRIDPPYKKENNDNRWIQAFFDIADFMLNKYHLKEKLLKECPKEPDSFAIYLLENVYFNVFESGEPLQKLNRIFSSLYSEKGKFLFYLGFKRVLLAYLATPKPLSEEEEMCKISGLYAHFGTLYSGGWEDYQWRMEMVSRMYQLILAVKYKLPEEFILCDMDEFYNTLVDMFEGKEIKGFEHLKEITVSLDEIKDIANVIDRLYMEIEKHTKSGDLISDLIEQIEGKSFNCNYGFFIPYLYFHRDDFHGIYEIFLALHKLMFLMGICSDDSENDINRFCATLLRKIDKPCEEILTMIAFKKASIKKSRLEESLKNLFNSYRFSCEIYVNEILECIKNEGKKKKFWDLLLLKNKNIESMYHFSKYSIWTHHDLFSMIGREPSFRLTRHKIKAITRYMYS